VSGMSPGLYSSTRKRLRIKFIDGWKGWRMEDDYIVKVLRERYDLELCDRDPDYVYSIGVGFGDTDFLYPAAVKIVFIGENRTPDFNRFDYAIGFDHLEFGDRYLRFPLFVTYPSYRQLIHPDHALSDAELLNRKFCSFVVSNRHGDPLRERFFAELGKYKQVDSGGRVLNNVGGRVADKVEFCSKYKFNIAFENSVYPGYVTEKLIDGLAAQSVPVYYGDPLVARDVNPGSFVSVRNADDIERAINEVRRLDSDDDAYLAMCKTPKLVVPAREYDARLRRFLANVFDPPKESARRLAEFGSQANYRRQLKGHLCPKFPIRFGWH